jgi:hypothetical protein
LGLGEAEAEVTLWFDVLGLGDGAPYRKQVRIWLNNRQWGNSITGVKAFAFGLGLNEEALTFSRLLAAVLGDIGVVGATGVELDTDNDPEGCADAELLEL